MIIRMMPYDDYESVISEKEKGIVKELKAATGIYHPIQLDYSPIFSRKYEDRSVRMAYNLPLYAPLHSQINQAFNKSRITLPRRTYYPRTSRKTIGKSAQFNASLTYPRTQTVSDNPESLLEIEKIYSATGFRTYGVTEMRSSWKFSQMKPRLYYAQGPNQYHYSKYIQPIFNQLVDLFTNTHTFKRFLSSTVEQTEDDTAFIYDYSSFTSTLHEIQYFTGALAEFFQDVDITVLDTHVGFITISLGEMIATYNQTCNIAPEFDISELFVIEEYLLSHNCGMLGVPGNISSCTLLHGIHLSIVMSSIERNKVVGDDAFGMKARLSHMSKKDLHEALTNIGVLELIKMEFWAPDDPLEDIDNTWNYVKRPIKRVGQRMLFGEMVDWPSIANVFNLQDDYHTITPITPYSQRKIYAGQLHRFLVTVKELSIREKPEEFFISMVLKSFHRELDIDIRGEICFNGVGLNILPAYWSENPIAAWCSIFAGHACTVPIEFDPLVPEEGPGRYVGDVWRSRSIPLFRTLSDLEYISKECIKETIVVDDDVDRFDRFFSRNFKCMYLFYVVKSLPKWYESAVHLVTHVPHMHSISEPSDEFGDNIDRYALDEDFV